MGLDEEDACDVLARLTPSDLVRRLVSERTGERMYVFRSSVGGTVVVKVVLRADCVVISFHEEEGPDEDE
jgi:hypothetical protein